MDFAIWIFLELQFRLIRVIFLRLSHSIPSKKRNPPTLFQDIKKSDSENVYSSLKGLGANHIRITAAKIQKF